VGQFALRRHVALIGFMGVGKTTVGRQLAQQLRVRFMDSDQIIANVHGSIPEIFQQRGEAAFRQLEAATVQEMLQRDPAVMALGGGAVLDAATFDRVLRESDCFWLDDDLSAIRSRLGAHSEGRPLAAKGESELAGLHEERTKYYCRADHRIDCRNLEPQHIAAKIEHCLRKNAR